MGAGRGVLGWKSNRQDGEKEGLSLTIEILRDFYGLKDFVQSSEGHK